MSVSFVSYLVWYLTVFPQFCYAFCNSKWRGKPEFGVYCASIYSFNLSNHFLVLTEYLSQLWKCWLSRDCLALHGGGVYFIVSNKSSQEVGVFQSYFLILPLSLNSCQVLSLQCLAFSRHQLQLRLVNRIVIDSSELAFREWTWEIL